MWIALPLSPLHYAANLLCDCLKKRALLEMGLMRNGNGTVAASATERVLKRKKSLRCHQHVNRDASP